MPCNKAKGTQPVGRFLAHDDERLAVIAAQARPSLRHAGVMNSLNRRLVVALGGRDKPVRTWSSHRTHANRVATGLPETHTLDALAVGPLDHDEGAGIVRVPGQILVVSATGRGSYARTTPDRFGFPRMRRVRSKCHFGYATGDLVRATIPDGKWAGTWTGRISVRARGQHCLAAPQGRINVSHSRLRLLQRGDGYAYGLQWEAGSPRARKTG
ncbi:hypothetical protein G3I40_33680 [Streptomyces sp. SID14478]|uniref:hypothetical protein n=1 Tax=Streptomyces sp. SID14478 TaxID=2706073 RepID=UPI0013E0DFB6|nr:hypothetical protein [Streptomyces sp. SID14478]NEB80122.1 hypothetical protein [Streptomyces sp. SID14478]